jgi:hypothetical protein
MGLQAGFEPTTALPPPQIALSQSLTYAGFAHPSFKGPVSERFARLRTEEVTDGSRLSAATRFESLVRVSNAIGAYRDPQELFGALVRELHRVVPFDYIGVSIRDEKSNTFHRHSIDAETEAAIPPDPELAMG